MAIRKIQLQHSTFDLQYDENKLWTADDTALIYATEILIKYEIKKGKDYDDQFYAFASFKKEMELVENSFDILSQNIKELINSVDGFEFELIGFNKTKIDVIINLLGEKGEMIAAFHEELTKLSEHIKRIESQENDGNIEDGSGPEWKAFNNARSTHSKNWKTQSIDDSSFEDFLERMFVNFDLLEKRSQNARFFINDTTLMYNVFIAKVNGLYQLWEELQKRIVLLNRFLNSADSIDKIEKLN